MKSQINTTQPTSIATIVRRARINKIKVDKLIAEYRLPQKVYEPVSEYRLAIAQEMDAKVRDAYDVIHNSNSSDKQRCEAVSVLNSIQSYYSSICP